MAFQSQQQASQQEHRQSMVPSIAQALRLYASSKRAEVTTADAKHDALSFLQYVMTDDLGKPIVVDTFTRIFVQAWADCMKQNRHLSFTAPPGLGKSSLARLLMLHSIGKANHLRTVITSANKSDATNAVNLCRGIVMSQPFRDVFPGVEPDVEKSTDAKGWKQNEWYLRTQGQRKDPTMRSWASMPTGESIRVDLLLADDIVGQKTFEGATHERIVKAFHSTWIEGRLSNGGWCCYLQNVRGSDDLLHRLRHSPKFCSVWVGVTTDLERMFVKVWNPPRRFALRDNAEKFGLTVVDADIEQDAACFQAEFALPKRDDNWTKERLQQIEPNARLSMYQLVGTRSDDLMFKHWHSRRKENMTAAQLIGVKESNGLCILNDLDRHRLIITAGLDISGENRRGTAFWILAQDRNGNKYPLEHWVIKGDIEQAVNLIDDAWQRGLHFALLQVETNGVQSAIKNVIKTLARYNSYQWVGRVVPFHTGSNKFDVHLGLPALDVEFSTQTIVWPEKMAQLGHRTGDTQAMKEIGNQWLDFEIQIARLTRDATKHTTPDGVMSFWFAEDGFRKTGFTSGNLMPQTIAIRRKNISI